MTKAYYVIMPGCQTFASLDADGILSLNDYKNRILEKDLPFDKKRYKVLGAFSAAEEGFFFAIKDNTQGTCFMAGYNREGVSLWENHVLIDRRQYGIPYQSLIDGENNQLFVSTELGCLFAIDIESGQKQDIPFSPPFNKSLDLELIATTLYAAGKERGSLYAFDALSHQLKWHFPQIGEISGYSLPTLFACSGDWHLLFGGANGKLYGIDRDYTQLSFRPPITTNVLKAFRPVSLDPDRFAVPIADSSTEEPTKVGIYR